ncbi:MAG: prepilin-type N-terminal cleavage/methylation domain-containing protein [Nitrospina sp.]|nr:prepilin-type N-terminal cleavage/methylation domain-containing protein [Nitrospina sp.]
MTPRHKRSDQSGFTLLELLLVVTLLSVTAFMTLSAVENNTDQVRFEDTRNRLTLIRKAIVGETQPVYNGQRLLSGYVVDNGRLPEVRADLTTQHTDYDTFSLRIPAFDQDPVNGTGLNDATNNSDVTGGSNQLFKGYRGGYLTLPPGSNNFNDGWGNGFTGTVTATVFPSTTLGKDNVAGGVNLYEPDITDTIEEADWTVDLEGWNVMVQNTRGSTVSASGGCFRVSLLVYVNNDNSPADNFNWRRLTSDCVVGDDLVVGNNTMTFPAPDAVQTSMRIPQGEHLLLLVQDADNTTRHNGISETHTFDADSTVTGTQLATAHVNFYAGVARPNPELTIR